MIRRRALGDMLGDASDPPCMVDIAQLFDGMAQLQGEKVVHCSPKAQKYTKVGANIVESVPNEDQELLHDAIKKQERLRMRTTLSGHVVDLTVFGTLVLFSDAGGLKLVSQSKTSSTLCAADRAAEKGLGQGKVGASSTSLSASSNLSTLQTAFSYESDVEGNIVHVSAALKSASFVRANDKFFEVHQEDRGRFKLFEKSKLELLGDSRVDAKGKSFVPAAKRLIVRVSRSDGGWEWCNLIATPKPSESKIVITTVSWTVSVCVFSISIMTTTKLSPQKPPVLDGAYERMPARDADDMLDYGKISNVVKRHEGVLDGDVSEPNVAA